MKIKRNYTKKKHNNRSNKNKQKIRSKNHFKYR